MCRSASCFQMIFFNLVFVENMCFTANLRETHSNNNGTLTKFWRYSGPNFTPSLLFLDVKNKALIQLRTDTQAFRLDL